MIKNFKIEIKWAVVFSLATIVWTILEKSIGLHDKYIAEYPIYTNLFGIPAITLFVLALKEKKKNTFNGIMSWQQGFVVGTILSFFIAIFCPMTLYIMYTYVSPDFFQNVIDYKVKNNVMTLEDASRYFNLKSYIIQGTFNALSLGVITAAIVALFVKTKSKN